MSQNLICGSVFLILRILVKLFTGGFLRSNKLVQLKSRFSETATKYINYKIPTGSNIWDLGTYRKSSFYILCVWPACEGILRKGKMKNLCIYDV